MRPYALISDTHNHGWSAFSKTLPTGVNDRLQFTLNEFTRAAQAVLDAGGCRVYHGGDLFHVRGSVSPSVFNPTRDLLMDSGVAWTINAGNHDLEGKNATRLGNSVEMIRAHEVEVVSKPVHFDHEGTSIVVVPWHETIADLKVTLEDWARGGPGGGAHTRHTDLIIHAPVDGVITGLPNHGLTPVYLASLGYKRVFAGHYHDAVNFGNGVISIGALTHQTWNDVDSKAGFWLVYEDHVEWFPTRAPRFVDIEADMDPVIVKELVKGNYVRVKIGGTVKPAELKDIREWLEKDGAIGVRIDMVKEPERVRAEGSTVTAGASVETSITDYVKASKMPEQVAIEAQKVYAEAA